MTPTGWRAGALVAAAVTLGRAGDAVRRRRLAMREVAPELRSPWMQLPLPSLTNRLALGVGRRAGSRPSEVRPGVDATCHQAELPGAVPVPVWCYRPERAQKPAGALLWMHGGGFILGAAEYDHAWCSTVADELGVVVVNVDYRLAPEHPHPAALDDCFTALRWLHGQAGTLGVDPARVAVGGSSAGGGLAAALAQRATDERVPVSFQLLRHPMLDDRTCCRESGDVHFGWTPRSNRFAWRSYLADRPCEEQASPYAAPARRSDLRGLPPAWIGVGDLDLFLAEDLDYATRLRRDGVPCELMVVPGMYHGADGDRPGATAMRAFRDAQLQALRSALDPGRTAVSPGR